MLIDMQFYFEEPEIVLTSELGWEQLYQEPEIVLASELG